MKQCNKCLRHKSTAEFGKLSRSRDGLNYRCKSCVGIYKSKWVANNPDKVIANKTKWNAANPEKVKAWRTKWKAANPEKVKASKAKYNASYRHEHPEKVKASMDKWWSANPEANRIYCQNRRARKSGEKLSSGLVERLFSLQRGKCACCKKPLGDDYHVDHIMPLSLGGTNEDTNIQLLHSKCNQQKHKKHPIEFMQQKGFLL